MTSPTSIRFDEPVLERLASYVARHPGLTRSAVAARYVDEGLRMEEHPGVVFRNGPMGRRATLVGGPDVWEVVRAVTSARVAEPKLGEAALLSLVEDNTGVPARLVHTALGYWSVYRDEIDSLLSHVERLESQQRAAAESIDELLAP